MYQTYNVFFSSSLFTADKDLQLMGFPFILLAQPKDYLGLINTLFSARIQGLFGSGFELTSKGFGSVFVCELIQPPG